jgi:hypothetical protein
MTTLLDGIDTSGLLQHLPSTMRGSFETLERASADWNTLGNLLAATPNTGVLLTGTGQWTSDLWQAVKWEFRSFLCTDSEHYAVLRRDWDALKQRSSALAVSSLTTVMGAKLGVAAGVLAPLVTWLFLVARLMGNDAFCVTLSTAPGTGSILPRSPVT